MRCPQCDQSNPENHRFCGMCGAKLEQPIPAPVIDDSDPLELNAPEYCFEDRSHTAQSVSEFRDRERQRELVRDSAGKSPAARSSIATSAVTVENYPPDTAQEAAVEEEQERQQPPRAGGIGGPSLLGLNYEGSNTGFVYDTPRNDGFIYDTEETSPEYLLEDVPRGVSWRAWALVLLLLAGAGLGFMQWRATHNGGFDIDSLLARNGATIDPNHPVVTPEAAKPVPKKPADSAAQNPPAQEASSDAGKQSSAEAAGDAEKASDSDGDAEPQSAKSGTTDSPTAGVKPNEKSAKADADSEDSATDENNNNEDAAKPESDGPPAKVAKASATKPRAIEEKPIQPKPLGDKDPRILEAEKYIQGRGVPQNCSRAVNLLREAVSSGNPAADVKMGALYWSGTCVTQSNVTAYEWFARAHSIEPRNRWIERSKNSVWAGLTPQEKQRVSY